jgi:serine/threonine-protein kinase
VTEGLIGRRLDGGKYEIRDVLGRGGMATVYRAHSFPLDGDVAVKVLAPRLAQDEGFRERLREEARSLHDLFHPNIVPVMDLDEEGGLVYIVMRLVSRGTLKDRLNLLGAPLDLTTTARIIGQIAEGLQYAHEKGLVHLDIKPANILLGGADWPLLADFGITRAIRHQQTEHGHERLAGTPAYMSPEQCRGGSIDGRSDEYSLAITAYELLTGRRPFEAQTTEDLLQQQIETTPPRPRELNPGIPGPVEAVLMRGLAKDPNDRYPTVRAFGRALTGAVEQTRGVSLEAKAALAAVVPNLIGVLVLILLAPFLLGSLPNVRLLGTSLPLAWPFQFFVALLVGFLLLRVRWHVVGLVTRAIGTIVGGLGGDPTTPAGPDQRDGPRSTALTGAVEGAVNLAYLYGGYRLLAVPVLDLAHGLLPPSIAQYLAGGVTVLAILLTLGALAGIGRLAGPFVVAGVGVVAFGAIALSPTADLGLPTETRLAWSVDAALAVVGLVALIAARFPVRRLATWLADQVLVPLVVVTRPTVNAADLAVARRQLSRINVALGDLLLLLGADVVLRPPLVTALGSLIGSAASAIAVSGLLGLVWLVLAARLRRLGGFPGLALAVLLGLPLLLTLPLLDPAVLGSTWPQTVTAWILATAATLLIIVARRPLQSVCAAAVGPVVDRRLAGVRWAPDEDASERRVGACAGLVGGILDVGLLIVAYWLLGMPLVNALARATGQSWLGSAALGGLVLLASLILWLRLRAARAVFAETGGEVWARRAGAASAMALGLAALLVAGCAALPTALAAPATERFGGTSTAPLDHVLVNWQFWQPDTPRSGASTYNVALSCSNGDALGNYREAFQPASGSPLPSGNVGLTDPRVNPELMPCAAWRETYFDLRQAAGLGTQPSLSWNWVDVRVVLGADGTADVVERHWVAFTEGAADHLEWVEPGDTQGAIQGLDIQEGGVAYPLDPTGPAPDRYARSTLAGPRLTVDWFFPMVTAPAGGTYTLHYQLPHAIELVGDRKRFSRQVLLPRAGPAWRATIAVVLPQTVNPDSVALTTSDAVGSHRLLDGQTAWFESKDQPADGSLTVGIEFADRTGPTPTLPPSAVPTTTDTAVVAVDLTATPTETATETATPTEAPSDSPTETVVATASLAPTQAATPTAALTSTQAAATSRPTATPAPAPATPTLSATPVPPTTTATSSPTPMICSGDEAMTFSPTNPIVGQQFTIAVTASQNDANVKFSGPDNPQGPTTRTNNGRFEWDWQVTPSSAGHKDYYFFAQTSTLCTTNFIVVLSPTPTVKPSNTSTPIKPTSTWTPVPAKTPTNTVVGIIPGGPPTPTPTPQLFVILSPPPVFFLPTATPTPIPIG